MTLLQDPTISKVGQEVFTQVMTTVANSSNVPIQTISSPSASSTQQTQQEANTGAGQSVAQQSGGCMALADMLHTLPAINTDPARGTLRPAEGQEGEGATLAKQIKVSPWA